MFTEISLLVKMGKYVILAIQLKAEAFFGTEISIPLRTFAFYLLVCPLQR